MANPFLDYDSVHCPFCGSENLENRSPFDGNSLLIACLDCKQDWEESYNLVSILYAETADAAAQVFPVGATPDAIADALPIIPVLPGTPYRVRLEIADGENQYGDDAYFLCREGQDADELADAIACFNLYSEGCFPYAWGDYFEERGGYRLCRAYSAEVIKPETYPSSYDLSPSSQQLFWARVVQAGVANFDATAIPGAVTTVNVIARVKGKRHLMRVYVSTLLDQDQDDRALRAIAYARKALDVRYSDGDEVDVLDAMYWQKRVSKRLDAA